MSDSPAAELRTAARHMRERADEMDADMDRRPWAWRRGYGGEAAFVLGGPAGAMAAPWNQETVRAIAGWLEATAGECDRLIVSLDGPFCHRCGDHLACPEPSGCCVLGPCRCWDSALAVARAYLGTGQPAGQAELPEAAK